jgi:hypothetical protein
LNHIQPYFAIVLFDGDHMGEWLSGKYFLPEIDFSEGQERLVSALMGFVSSLGSEDWPETTTASMQTIYTGGDDGFLLCALDGLLPIIRRIHELWEEKLSVVSAYATEGLHPTLTLHASIVHAMTPLQPAIRQAFETLTASKERLGRDGVSFLSVVRSGAATHFLAHWDELPPLSAAIETFSDWSPVSAHPTEDKPMSSSLLYTLMDQAQPFFLPDKLRCVMPREFELELDRLVGRSGTGDPAPARWETIREWLLERANEPHRSVQQDRDAKAANVGGGERFQTALATVAFLARLLQRKEVA